MSDLRMDPKEMAFYIKAVLPCGAEIEIFQREKGTTPWEFIVKPKLGTTPEDFCQISNGKVKLFVAEESALGIWQLMYMAIGPRYSKTGRKKFLGMF